ncbi:MAG: hypothetical protein AB7P46_03585 [Thermoanaerobaculia bacterium]
MDDNRQGSKRSEWNLWQLWGLWALVGFYAAAAAFAQSDPLPLTAELQVNQFATGGQEAPRVAMSPTGVHVVVWSSPGQDGDGVGVILRRFPADGSAPFNESVLNQSTTGDQGLSDIGMNANGNWIAVWRNFAGGASVRGRAASNGGTTLGSEFEISQTTQPVDGPAAARTNDGGFVASWGANVGVRFFDNSLQPVTGDISPAPALSGIFRPRVAALPLAGSVVAMAAADNDVNGVFAQRFDAAGDPVGDLIPVPENESHDQKFAVVDAAADGSFVIAWQDTPDGVRVRCFEADGTPRSAEIPVSGVSVSPEIAVSPGGAFVVTYSVTEVLAREFDRTCQPIGPEFLANTTTSGFQAGSAAAAGNDRFVIVWHSANLDGDGLGIARRIFRFRSIFSDNFESGDDGAWSNGSL